jgi:hypothetical protein
VGSVFSVISKSDRPPSLKLAGLPELTSSSLHERNSATNVEISLSEIGSVYSLHHRRSRVPCR